MRSFLWWTIAVIFTFSPVWLFLLFWGIKLYNSRIPPAVKQAAKQGDAKAQILMGDRYHHDKHTLRSYKKAAKWYLLAAEQGDAEAQARLGNCYSHGKGMPKDSKEAIRWYRLAAEQRHIGAQCALGRCCSEGNGVPKDHKESVKWYRLAAEQGDAWAQCVLGRCYLDGNGVPQDYKESLKWFCLAEEQGNEIIRLAAATARVKIAKDKAEKVRKENDRRAEESRKEKEQQRAQQQEDEQRRRESQNQSDTRKKDQQHYASVLNLHHDSISMEAVRRNYRELTKQYHPDKVHSLGSKLRDVAESEMKAINEAYAYFENMHENGSMDS